MASNCPKMSCVAVGCSVLQCKMSIRCCKRSSRCRKMSFVAVCCSVLQCVAV